MPERDFTVRAPHVLFHSLLSLLYNVEEQRYLKHRSGYLEGIGKSRVDRNLKYIFLQSKRGCPDTLDQPFSGRDKREGAVPLKRNAGALVTCYNQDRGRYIGGPSLMSSSDSRDHPCSSALSQPTSRVFVTSIDTS
jgi:hypothetical protein